METYQRAELGQGHRTLNGPGPPGAGAHEDGAGWGLGSTGTPHAGGGGQAEPLCR